VIFIDSNVPMYLIGGEHPHKFDAQRTLERLASERRRLVTDSEVFQEIARRYARSDQRELIDRAFSLLGVLVDEVLAIELEDVLEARALLDAHSGLSARDALHLAVMRRHQIGEIVSFDRGLDEVGEIARLPG
jgi:uncharacterized protein